MIRNYFIFRNLYVTLTKRSEMNDTAIRLLREVFLIFMKASASRRVTEFFKIRV